MKHTLWQALRIPLLALANTVIIGLAWENGRAEIGEVMEAGLIGLYVCFKADREYGTEQGTDITALDKAENIQEVLEIG